MSFKRTLVTAALPYANGPLHIGHLAGCYLPADLYVRYLRLKRHEVVFICGSDEHGVAITMQALKQNQTPKAIIDKYHPLNQKTFERLGITFDIFDRTSAPHHHRFAQSFFLDLYEKGILEERESIQFYDPKVSMFLPDRYIYGTCPICGYERAYGDQCEQCGSSLSPSDLIQPRSAITDTIPEKRKTKHWYFPLDRFQTFLENYIQQHERDWKPNVYGYCLSWLRQGLKPRAITRDLSWGVQVPLKGYENKVLYVWFDAPLGYISATQRWASQNGKDWKRYWQDPTTRIVHFIGKDNIVFHCLIFPAMLKAHGDYCWADQVPANEFLNLEGQKLSTSRNWAVWLHEYLEDFPNGQDPLRYVLTAIMPETKDSDFSWKEFQNRVNTELVATYSNFIYRVSKLLLRFFDGKVPVVDETKKYYEVFESAKEQVKACSRYLERFQFKQALSAFMGIAQIGNQFLSSKEPWRRVKENKTEAAEVLFTAAQIIALLGTLSYIFLPFAHERLKEAWQLPTYTLSQLQQRYPLLKSEHALKEAPMLFTKVSDEQIAKQLQKLKAIQS